MAKALNLASQAGRPRIDAAHAAFEKELGPGKSRLKPGVKVLRQILAGVSGLQVRLKARISLSRGRQGRRKEMGWISGFVTGLRGREAAPDEERAEPPVNTMNHPSRSAR